MIKNTENLRQNIIDVVELLPLESLKLLWEIVSFLQTHTTPQITQTTSATTDAWDVLETLTGSVEAPTDWALEHNHYLYGTPKNREKPS